MKYKNEVVIEENIDVVIELFDSTENMYKWMEGIQSHEFIEGQPGEVGSKMKMHFQMGKNKFDIIETILTKDLPFDFSATYDSKFSSNMVEVRFEWLSSRQTKYISETTIKTQGFMMKLMCFFMPNLFKKQSQKFLDSFKGFVENQP